MEQNKYFYCIGYHLPVFYSLKSSREFVLRLIETNDERVLCLNTDDNGWYYIVRVPSVILPDVDLSDRFFSVDKNYRGHIVKDGFILK